MSYSKVQLTAKGQAYLEDRYFSGLPLEFAKIELSSRAYTPDAIAALTVLEDVQQSETIRTISSGANPTEMEVEAFFSNAKNAAGFTVGSIGVYVLNPLYVAPAPLPDPEIPLDPEAPIELDPEEPIESDPEDPVEPDPEEPIEPETEAPIEPEPEAPIEPDPEVPVEPEPEAPIEPQYFLYGIAMALDNPIHIAPPSVNQFSLTLRLGVAIGQAEAVNVNVNPVGVATQGEFKSLLEKYEALKEVYLAQEEVLNALLGVE